MQWGLGAALCGMGCVCNAPLTSRVVFLVVDPCLWRWLQSRGKIDGACGMWFSFDLCRGGVVVGIVERNREILIDLCGVGEFV